MGGGAGGRILSPLARGAVAMDAAEAASASMEPSRARLSGEGEDEGEEDGTFSLDFPVPGVREWRDGEL